MATKPIYGPPLVVKNPNDQTVKTVDQLKSPDSKHFLHKLTELNSPEKRYLKGKPVHSVVLTTTPNASPFKDPERIRNGDATIEQMGSKTLIKVQSASSGLSRTYTTHESGSDRLIPHSGPGILRMQGASVADEVTKFQKESGSSSPTLSDLSKRLEARRKLDFSNPPPALPGPTTEAQKKKQAASEVSSLSLIPRSLKRKTLSDSSKENSISSANLSVDEPDAKRRKTTQEEKPLNQS